MLTFLKLEFREDAIREPSSQPISEDPALWEDTRDSSHTVRFYSSAGCPEPVAEFPVQSQKIFSQPDQNFFASK